VHDPRLVPVRVEVLDEGRSDHLPIVAEYALPSEHSLSGGHPVRR
jgi:hypothetical protein